MFTVLSEIVWLKMIWTVRILKRILSSNRITKTMHSLQHKKEVRMLKTWKFRITLKPSTIFIDRAMTNLIPTIFCQSKSFLVNNWALDLTDLTNQEERRDSHNLLQKKSKEKSMFPRNRSLSGLKSMYLDLMPSISKEIVPTSTVSSEIAWKTSFHCM